MLLPGNVVIHEAQGGTVVAALDPALTSRLSPSPGVEGVALEVAERRRRARGRREGQAA